MRCPDCAKFTGLDFDNDPEIQNDDFSPDDGTYSIEIRIVRTCSDCGQEMKEATLNFDGAIDGWDDIKAKHSGDDHDIEMEIEPQNDEYCKGKGRYTQSFFGVSVEMIVTCSCNKDEPLYTETFTDHVQASGMDELV